MFCSHETLRTDKTSSKPSFLPSSVVVARLMNWTLHWGSACLCEWLRRCFNSCSHHFLGIWVDVDLRFFCESQVEFSVRITSQENCYETLLLSVPLLTWNLSVASCSFQSATSVFTFYFVDVLRPLCPSLNGLLRPRLALASMGEGWERVLEPLNISRRLQKRVKLVN